MLLNRGEQRQQPKALYNQELALELFLWSPTKLLLRLQSKLIGVGYLSSTLGLAGIYVKWFSKAKI